jgi:hypothetical protein
VQFKSIDASSLSKLYPNPKPSDPTDRCGYCVGGSLMAYLDGVTAVMVELGQKPNWREHYYPVAAELAVTLQQANPALPDAVAKRYAAFITQLNDRKRFHFAWGYLKEALEWKEGKDSFNPSLV